MICSLDNYFFPITFHITAQTVISLKLLYCGKQFVTKLLTQRINILFSSTQTPLFLVVKLGESKG